MRNTRELVVLAARFDGVKTLSVYLDWSGSDPAQGEQWRVTLKQRIGALRASLKTAPHAEREAFEDCVARVLSLLPQTGSPRGARGWMGFATASGVTQAESLPVMVPTVVAWDDRLRLAPYVAVLEMRPALLVVVDHHRAVFHRYLRTSLSRIDDLEREEHVTVQPPMSDTPRRGFHPGTRGTAARDDAARQLQGAYARFRSDVRRHIEALDRSGDYVVLAGAPEVVAHVASDLAPARRSRTHLAHEVGATASGVELVHAVARGVEALRSAQLREEIDEVLGESKAGGRAALGEPDVTRALERGAVELLLLTWRIIADHPEAAETLVRSALARGGRVEVARGADADVLEGAAGGIAARLRFRPLPAERSGAGSRAGGRMPARAG
ncbi:MAG: hypothetical protein ACHQQ3_08185 [Gemmatimonadales bacterium]